MNLFRLRSFEDYKKHVSLNEKNYIHMNEYERKLSKTNKKEFTVPGISYPAKQFVKFKVDYLYSKGKNINWRERLTCPITKLNNRLRSCIHLLDIELSPYPGSSIYISEQVTPLFSVLQKKFENVTGSEYLNETLISGTVLNGIRHEDMTKHSFADESLDYYLSFECFEHIPFYELAIKEIYRTLRPGGTFMGSFPFDKNAYNNLVRATIDAEGNIVHFLEPEYHGDPVHEQGILCFTVFGWEILDQFRNAGFRDAYAILLWSDIYGYLGGEQVYFIVKK